jgi:hypothetical protein
VLYSLAEAQFLFEQLPSGESLIEWYGRHDWWVGTDS